MSSSARWVICTVCAVLGVIALIYAVIYLAVPIHSLPGFVPGKHAANGHYHKRAALTGVIGIVLLAIAIFVGLGARSSAVSGNRIVSWTREPGPRGRGRPGRWRILRQALGRTVQRRRPGDRLSARGRTRLVTTGSLKSLRASPRR